LYGGGGGGGGPTRSSGVASSGKGGCGASGAVRVYSW
jgi:hypothetical protein